MALRAVLFDLDGTLLDTLNDIAGAMNLVLARRGLKQHPLPAYRNFVGDGAEMLVRRTLQHENPSDAMVRQCIADFKAAYTETWNICTKPYPGITGLLDLLAEKEIPAAVLSNKPHEFTVRCVETFLPRWHFCAVLGEHPGRPCKPDPAGALEAARLLHTAPQEICYLGDTNTDMQTAISAGMLPVGVRWGFRPASELLAAGARHLIEAPAELLALLG